MRTGAKRILIVDDDEAMRTVVNRFAERLGYNATAVSNGYAALKLLSLEKFDLVLTDLMMPDMNGDTLADEIKKLNPRLPIALMTGSIYQDDVNGFLFTLNKPFSLAELQTVLKTVFPTIDMV